MKTTVLQKCLNLMTWTQIQRIQDYKALKSMYFWLIAVPVLAKLLNKVNGSVFVEIMNAKIELTMSLPFSWQYFYFSALSIVIGDLIFHNACPGILKDHRSYSHFRDEGKAEHQIISYADEIDEYEMVEEILDLANGRAASDADLRSAFWSLFALAQERNEKSRMACAAAYFIGLGLIGVVMIENFWAVILLTLDV